LATEALALGRSPATDVLLADAPAITEIQRQRVDLAGILIDQVDVGRAIERIGCFARSGGAHQLVTVNVDFLRIAERNPEFRATINQADLAVADGMPLVWASRLMRQPLPERVTGVELVDACCGMAAEAEDGVFLLGAGPGVADAAAMELRDRYPGLRVDSYAPPFGPLDPDEDERITNMILAAAPTYLFVALGAPRQDLWIRAHQDRVMVPVAMGVGCVLDLLAGAAQRAPAWMRRSGLEWSYRLAREPGRLWRRYILNDFPMLGRLILASVPAGPASALDSSQPPSAST
jgi:N-acetylglucosaminyldiphosphoundecaprenol N-acetyl-beta-D-mannosaminyltransferase